MLLIFVTFSVSSCTTTRRVYLEKQRTITLPVTGAHGPCSQILEEPELLIYFCYFVYIILIILRSLFFVVCLFFHVCLLISASILVPLITPSNPLLEILGFFVRCKYGIKIDVVSDIRSEIQ